MISSISQLIGRVQWRAFVPRSSPGGASRGWFGIGLSRPVHRQLPLIRQRADEFRRASDEQLRQRVVALRQQWQGFSDHATLTQGAALALEGFRRALGVELYDVQVEAGLSLTQRCVVEMQTGEGKTFAVGLAAFLCAAADRGVHVATTNAYLAARDCEQVRPVLELLGLSVAALPETHDDDLKHRAYLCDVTYGTGYDFGFDYLRDQVRLRARSRQSLGADFLGQLSAIRRPGLRPLQQRRGIALIDEADSVLIDEAAMPLVLSGAVPRQISEELYQTAIRTAESLVMDSDFVLEAGTRAIREAIQHRPEVVQSLRKIKAATIRTKMSENELLPILNLVTEAYAAGIDTNYDTIGAMGRQLDRGNPSYSIGLQYEIPIGNRAAGARHIRRHQEMRMARNQYQSVLENIRMEVEVAVRETQTSFQELSAKQQAMQARENQLHLLTERWERLPGQDVSASLALENLLSSQDQLSEAEYEFLKAQMTYSLSLTNLKKSTGTLLQSESVSIGRGCDHGVPTQLISKPTISRGPR